MAYLCDTNVISASSRPGGTASEVAEWLDLASDRIWISTMTVAEIRQGIAKLRGDGAERKARHFEDWLGGIERFYAARILPLDLRAAHVLGDLMDAARRAGHVPGLADLIIAATARVHDLIVVTRNVRHFERLGVPVLNPFETLPD